MVAGQGSQGLALFRRGRQGFFDQYVHPRLQTRLSHCKMELGGGGDADRIGPPQNRLQCGVGGHVQFPPNDFSPFRIGIHHPDELATGQRRIFLCVVTSQVTHSDYGGPDGLVHGSGDSGEFWDGGNTDFGLGDVFPLHGGLDMKHPHVELMGFVFRIQDQLVSGNHGFFEPRLIDAGE